MTGDRIDNTALRPLDRHRSGEPVSARKHNQVIDVVDEMRRGVQPGHQVVPERGVGEAPAMPRSVNIAIIPVRQVPGYPLPPTGQVWCHSAVVGWEWGGGGSVRVFDGKYYIYKSNIGVSYLGYWVAPGHTTSDFTLTQINEDWPVGSYHQVSVGRVATLRIGITGQAKTVHHESVRYNVVYP